MVLSSLIVPPLISSTHFSTAHSSTAQTHVFLAHSRKISVLQAVSTLRKIQSPCRECRFCRLHLYFLSFCRFPLMLNTYCCCDHCRISSFFFRVVHKGSQRVAGIIPAFRFLGTKSNACHITTSIQKTVTYKPKKQQTFRLHCVSIYM